MTNCETCGKEIEAGRLLVLPNAPQCAKCVGAGKPVETEKRVNLQDQEVPDWSDRTSDSASSFGGHGTRRHCRSTSVRQRSPEEMAAIRAEKPKVSAIIREAWRVGGGSLAETSTDGLLPPNF